MAKHPLPICHDCGLAKKECYCDQFPKIETKDRITIITTKTEGKIRSNTGRWLQIMFENSNVIYLGEKGWEERVENEISLKEYYPILFYPSPNSKSPEKKQAEAGKPFNIIVLDTGWRTARRWNYKKIFADLPRLELKKKYDSRYFLRSVPNENYLCTLQSVACLLVEMDESYTTVHNKLMNTMDTIVKLMASERGSKIEIDGVIY